MDEPTEFILLDCSSRGKSARNICIGATFSGTIHAYYDAGWYRARTRRIMRNRGIDPDAYFSDGPVYYGTVSMLQPKKGSRAKSENWSKVFFRWMKIRPLVTDFDID